MLQDVLAEVVRLTGATYGPLAAIVAIVVLAVLMVAWGRVGTITWPTPPLVSPNPEDTPGSPPIIVRPDGSIPVSNPVTPPDPGPM
jgi:hypothetical protein